MPSQINTLLICETPEAEALIENALLKTNYNIVFRSDELKTLLMQQQLSEPELLIISLSKTDPAMLDQLKIILEQYPMPIVIFTNDDQGETIEHAINAGVSAYIVDGLKSHRILPILKTAMLRFKQHFDMHQQLQSLQTSLADRKIIERAKGLLMTQRNCSEDEAYRLLRSSAMNQNIRLAELAHTLIKTADLLNTKT